MKKVALYTLGCRVNVYETEAITESFTKNGYEVVDFEDFADVYVINTCTVTNIGDKKSRKMLRKAKKINPEAIVVAAGCYAQVSPEEIAEIEEVDIVVGTSDKSKIVDFVNEYKLSSEKKNYVNNIMSVREFEEMEIDEYHDKTRAFLKIQDGCDRYCSYCLIPYARGPVRSRDIDSIENQVKGLVENGFKEVILSGIHISSYGKDLGSENLVDVVEILSKIEGLERIRIGSIEPMFFSEGVLERLKAVKSFCPHFHLSLQSGCDETLKRMNRRYTADEYREVVDRIRDTFEDAAITTDIIVGFPGETDEEFEATYKFLSEIKLSKMHIFKYSERKGTKAAMLSGKVDPKKKEERSKILTELDEKCMVEFMEKYLGREMKVLFEEEKEGIFMGYTENYIKIIISSDTRLTGKILSCRLNNISGDGIIGELI
ncbi:tRNA (N(6)-L-threonylcarbamoyladenosine(37)-C(2))-methylthiotransferase MtaB [Clostridium cylindrosporum]|uniref:Threonylcarbamoyladenosine tRNA methylthiotransferase MtaB n=1 Tax=Clostridium cylindrosporum DSM 605 TaxID=1121307 RepID=A0A0J8G1L1_CLOCY|nr:tRNA (N(6)-L-threonylcarbamoyladenosine(37)-C(2))-methylthiotransferase MtaB [Clostridium cylindrosporum]KMT21646.1 threonylcarbamoyladenosine tRNA methylthiotransferase MtaB [Clostridium cylindrosporum DSM 605]